MQGIIPDHGEKPMLDSLDDAAAAFHDYPCYATADRYSHIAIDFAAAMMITMPEVKNIIKLCAPYLGLDTPNLIGVTQ